MAKLVQKVANELPIYSSSKNYKWDPTDIFEITGQQFASFYHALKREMDDPGGAPLYLKVEAFQTMMEIFIKGVEQGVIVEQGSDLKVDSSLEDNVKALFNNSEKDKNENKRDKETS